MPDTSKRERPVVIDLRQAQPTVLLRHLDPQRTDLLEPVDHVVGDLRVTLDLERIHLGLEEPAQSPEETLALFDHLRVQPRLRMDQIEPEVTQEQLLAETRQLPLRLTRGFDDVTGLLL